MTEKTKAILDAKQRYDEICSEMNENSRKLQDLYSSNERLHRERELASDVLLKAIDSLDEC